MSEFDDLFDKQVEKRKKYEEQNINNFSKEIIDQSKNGILFLIYIFISLIFSFGVLIYSSNIYPDSEVILDNITMVGPTMVDPVYDEANSITGIDFNSYIKNDSLTDIPKFNVDVELFDINENSLGTIFFSHEDFLSGSTIPISDTLVTDTAAASFEVSYNLDLSVMFYIIFGTLQPLLGSIVFIVVDKKAFKTNWQALKEQPRKYIIQMFVGFGIIIGTLLVSSYILDLIGVSDTSQNEATIRSYFEKDSLRLVMIFFMLCVFTPVFEEVIFRKVIFNFIEPKTNSIVAIIGTGFIFGLMHVISYGDFIQSIPYILMGTAIGYIYYHAEKNILVSIGAHFLNNFFAYMIYILVLYGYYGV